MKYIISADLWLTAGIGQQPHLLKKQRQNRQQYHKLELAQKLALGVEPRWGMWLCGTREGEGGGEGHTPAHRAFGKLHALAHAHAHAIAHIHGHVACHGTPIWPKHAHTPTRAYGTPTRTNTPHARPVIIIARCRCALRAGFCCLCGLFEH